MNTYSKTGDAGETSIIGGKRLLKDDIRIASYGVIDELSSEIGLLITYCSMEHDIQFLQQVQRELFIIGGYLASDLDVSSLSETLAYTHICRLETEIDTISRELPPFKEFILPGGCRSASVAHVCRTICRRAERKIVAFLRTQECLEDNVVLAYINRLSDYFFSLARRFNVDEGVEELTW
jgi:cob(I)alamin adenosyltransferase